MFYNIAPLTVLKVTLPSRGLVIDVCDHIHDLYAALSCAELCTGVYAIAGHTTHLHIVQTDEHMVAPPLLIENVIFRSIESQTPDWEHEIDRASHLLSLEAKRNGGFINNAVDDISWVIKHLKITGGRVNCVLWAQVVAYKPRDKDLYVVSASMGKREFHSNFIKQYNSQFH